MRTSWSGVGLSLCALAFGAVSATAAAPKHRGHHHARHAVAKRHKAAHVAYVSASGAENQLLGIHLYDSMLKILSLYGTPDSIEPLAIGTGAAGGPGFGGGGFGGAGGAGGFGRGGMAPGGPGMPGMPGMRGRGGAGGPGGVSTPADSEDPFGFGDVEPLDQFPAGGARPPGAGGQGGPGGPGFPGMGRGGRMGPGGPGYPGMGPGGPGGPGYPGMGPGGPGAPGFPGRGGQAGGPGLGGGAAEEATYTRWVYNRNDNKYGFVVDKNGHVIEIEAIGITNPKVETKRGVTFGTDFATIIRKYQNPDGYDIAGDNITVRYLVHDKVAFKLTRLGEKKPHTVTGIVVAAGKP